jgi:hypothetical protein
VFESGGARLVVHAGVPLEQVGDDVVASFEVQEGQDVAVVLDTAGTGPAASRRKRCSRRSRARLVSGARGQRPRT